MSQSRSSRARPHSTPRSSPARGCPRSASTTAWPPSAPAGCAWSGSRAAAPVPSCTTPCREGMRVVTRTSACSASPGTWSSSCSQSFPARPRRTRSWPRWRERLGVGEPRWRGALHPEKHDARHPYLVFQHELCISCGRCVRACDEVQGAFALTATGRGFHSNVTAGLDSGFKESSCVSCGACADSCPTDAITERFLFDLAEQGVGDER